MRTLPVSDPWKSTASERPSNAIESPRGRAWVQIAATLICGNVWSHPTNFHPPIDTHGTHQPYSKAATGLPETGRDEAEEPLVNRANISTHELISPPLVCFWASDDAPLAGIRGQP